MSNDEHLTTATDEFISYPTHRITCYFETVDAFRAAMKRFAAEGFDVKDILVLHGQEGIELLDPDGRYHGTLARLSRLLHKVMSEFEVHEFEIMQEHLEQGHIVIGVHAPNDAEREKAHQIMHDCGGHHIMYFANFYIETIEE